MASPKNLLPDCGLYRTTKPLPEHEKDVPAGTLVYFHNHSDSGLPVVIAPDHNIHNRWHFHGAGIPFRGLSWADSLVKLPARGLLHRCARPSRSRAASGPRARSCSSATRARGTRSSSSRRCARSSPRTTSSSATAASASRGSSSRSSSRCRCSPSPPPAGAHTTGVH